jgi:hypothetical protein
MSGGITGKDRVDAAIRLELLDRAPIAPLIIYFNAYYNGLDTKAFLFEPGKGSWAAWRTFDRLGGWDGWYSGSGGIRNPDAVRYSLPIREDLPGYGLPDDAPLPQYVEKTVMTVEDYDAIVEKGFVTWFGEIMVRAHPGVDLQAIQSAPHPTDEDPKATRKKLDEKGVSLLMGGTAFVPADLFSMLRTFKEFSFDLARVPEKVVAAANALWAPLTQLGIHNARESGSDVVWLGGWRTSASFLSPRQYARFVAPTLKLQVEMVVAAGMTPLLHFDANWTPMLSLLRELPAKKCILAADQETDLYKAKEVLGDRMCLMGNVSPQLLTLGTVDQVVEETRHLMDVVGKGGGFILSSGCEVPYNAKPENVAALIETGKTYGPR